MKYFEIRYPKTTYHLLTVAVDESIATDDCEEYEAVQSLINEISRFGEFIDDWGVKLHDIEIDPIDHCSPELILTKRDEGLYEYVRFEG